MKILITGGAGYIGSHVVKHFLKNSSWQIVVLDNLITGHRQSLPQQIIFYQGDLKNKDFIVDILEAEKPECVVHMAASIEVELSQQNPLLFYRNNVVNTLNLLEAMVEQNIKNILFSSTAAVFGIYDLPIQENFTKIPTSVYGTTKLTVESIIKDLAATKKIHYGILRYFNAAGASEDGEIGEDHPIETHLIPLIIQTALGKREKIHVFGNDYPTKDGSCIRDFIHVMDLADAHMRVVKEMLLNNCNYEYNLGTGKGTSVKEIICCIKKICNIDFTVEISPRRLGDLPFLVADGSKIKRELDWAPQYDIEQIIQSAWNWHKTHPQGFNS